MVDTPMPLTAHLAELRSRLIWCMVALVVGFSVCYTFSDKIVAALQSPRALVGTADRGAAADHCSSRGVYHLIIGGSDCRAVSGPASSFCINSGNLSRLACSNTRRSILYHFIIGSAVLFYSGGVVFYLRPVLLSCTFSSVMMPRGSSKSSSPSGTMWTFCIRLMIAFGLVFQLPIVAVFLTQLGLLSSRLLVKNFRYAVVLMFDRGGGVDPLP